MKNQVQKQMQSLLGTWVILTLCTGQVFAGQLSPLGSYSEAKAATPFVKPVASWLAEAPASVTAPQAGVSASVNGPISAQESTTGSSQVPAQMPAQVLSQDQSRIPAQAVGQVSGQKPLAVDTARAQAVDPTVLIANESQIPDVAAVKRLNVPTEQVVKASRYQINSDQLDYFKKLVPYQLASPQLFTSVELQALTKSVSGLITKPGPWVRGKFASAGAFSRAGVDEVNLKLTPEVPFQLAKVVPLTPDEFRFLSALMLFQQGDQCPTAAPMFHKLSHSANFQAEADYYLSQCAMTLGLKGDYFDRVSRVLASEDVFYSKKLLEKLDTDVPAQWIDTLGTALFKVAQNKKIMDWSADSMVPSNLYFILADFGLQTDRIKTAGSYSRMVSERHSKYNQAQYIAGISDYQLGARVRAIETLETLLARLEKSDSTSDLKSLTALNLGRLQFQEKRDKSSRESYLKIAKDHPLWLTALTEMGWSQLQGGDFEGAIGNMYSIHSPYFQAVFKPESHVIQTIGYLNLCQYADAYRSLTTLEKQYRPYLDKIIGYSDSHKGQTYQTVKSFVTTQKSNQEYDGLPSQVVREVARQKDYLILQKSLNQQIDEKEIYGKLDREIDLGLAAAQKTVTETRKKMAVLKQEIATSPDKVKINSAKVQLEKEMEKLNLQFFQIDLYNEAKVSLGDFKKDVVAGAEKRIASSKDRIEKVLTSRLAKMKNELIRVLDNNELLRYEVFAGSGENLRYQIAGGEKGKRVPANVLPKSKSLQWDFDGEYWEDEIGHYRSTLKNNCPDTAKQQTASLIGNVGGVQ